MSVTGGNGRSNTRCGSVNSVYWPRWALCQLSSDGVAEPSRIGMFSSRARITATSRA